MSARTHRDVSAWVWTWTMELDLGAIDTIGGQGFGRSAPETASDALELFGQRPPWMRDAACREHPEVNFHPGHGESPEPARAVCSRCMVRNECLQFALDDDERYGVWGGLSPPERRAVKRQLLHLRGVLCRIAGARRRCPPRSDSNTLQRS
jgi:WhiB family transcriptional regulator, redox-sensing transcriptional regulator